MKVVYRHEALDDLMGFYRWYVELNPPVALSLLRKVRDRVALLTVFPESGAPVPGRAERLLFVVGTPFVAVYLYDKPGEIVDVVSVVDIRRHPLVRFGP